MVQPRDRLIIVSVARTHQSTAWCPCTVQALGSTPTVPMDAHCGLYPMRRLGRLEIASSRKRWRGHKMKREHKYFTTTICCSCPDYYYRGRIRPCKHVVALRDAHQLLEAVREEIRNAEAQEPSR